MGHAFYMTFLHVASRCYKVALSAGFGLAHILANAQSQSNSLEQPDTLILRATTSLVRDNNFKLASDVQKTKEQISTLTLGMALSIPLSLQKLMFDAEIRSVRHKYLAGYDYSAQNLKASWAWSYTPTFNGNLFLGQAQALNPVTDSIDPDARNKNTTRTLGLIMSYGLTGQWQLLGSAQRSRSTNEQALVGGGDSDINSLGIGVRYRRSSGTFLGYDLRHDRGESDRFGNSSETVRRNFTSISHGLIGYWPVGPDTKVQAHLLRQSNAYLEDGPYDFSGLSGGVKLNYKLTEKIALEAGLQRELGGYQTESATHTQTDTFTLMPSWKIGPKTSFNLSYTMAVRRDKGKPADVASERRDSTYDSSLGLNWQPTRQVSLTARMSWGRRQSNIDEFDYSVQRSSVDALLTF